MYGMERISEAKAIELLKKHIKSNLVFILILSHGKAVQKLALQHAMKIKGVDIQFIKTASLLHDIGRYKYAPKTKYSYKHAYYGGQILRRENLPLHARVAETHIGFGITKAEVIKQKLNIPKKDFMPITKEEKIICYSDKFAKGSKVMTKAEIKARFSKEISKGYVKRFDKLGQEIERLKKGKA